jgi:hypothetical protein
LIEVDLWKETVFEYFVFYQKPLWATSYCCHSLVEVSGLSQCSRYSVEKLDSMMGSKIATAFDFAGLDFWCSERILGGCWGRIVSDHSAKFISLSRWIGQAALSSRFGTVPGPGN